MMRIPSTVAAPSTLTFFFKTVTFGVDLSTITAVSLNVLRRDGSTATWSCDIVSATAGELVAQYAFTGGDEISSTGVYYLSPILTSPTGPVPCETVTLFVYPPGAGAPMVEASSWVVATVPVNSLGPIKQTWVRISVADTPYEASAASPWIAVDLTDGDVAITLPEGVDGNAVVISDYLNQAGVGGNLTLTASGAQLLPVGDGTYEASVTYSGSGFSTRLKLSEDLWINW